MKIMTLLALTITLLFNSCNEPGKSTKSFEKPNEISRVTGDTVSQLSSNIMAIYQDKKNNYWFGSWHDGLFKYDGKTLIHYTTKHGLPSSRVEEI